MSNTYYVNNVLGDDSTGDGSQGDPWKTVGHGLDNLSPGDTLRLVVNAGTPYTDEHDSHGCVGQLSVYGEHDNPIIVEGYGGTAVIDGQDSLQCLVSSSGNWNYRFKNIRCTQSSSHGWDFQESDALLFESCTADNNNGLGFYCDNYVTYAACYAYSNTGIGIRCDNGINVYGCVVHHNTDGIVLGYGNVQFCVCYANSGNAIDFGTVQQFHSMIANNTCVYNGGGLGLAPNGSIANRVDVVNNIFAFNDNYGISSTVSGLVFARANVVYSNTLGNYHNWSGNQSYDLAVNPLFVDAGSNDYRLKIKSPAIRAGWPEFLDIGAYQAKRLPVGSPTNRGTQR